MAGAGIASYIPFLENTAALDLVFREFHDNILIKSRVKIEKLTYTLHFAL